MICEESRRADGGEGATQGVVELVGDPGIDGWEGHMDSDEVKEADFVSPVVFVLERLVDQVCDHHCAQQI